MEKAIKLAIEKGGYLRGLQWEWNEQTDIFGIWIFPNKRRGTPGDFKSGNDVFLDPLFWRALGKALGWQERHCSCNGYSYQCDCDFTWLVQAHEFFELKLTGGDEKKFWEELLK